MSLHDNEYAIATPSFWASFGRVCKRAKIATSLVIFARFSVGLSVSIQQREKLPERILVK
jgi:hypothetical protein